MQSVITQGGYNCTGLRKTCGQMALLYLFLQLRHVTGSPRRINTVPECSVAVSPLWGELASLPSSKPFCWKHSKKMKYAHYTPKKNKSPIIPVSKYNWCSSFGDYFLYRSFFFLLFFTNTSLVRNSVWGTDLLCELLLRTYPSPRPFTV